MIIKEMSFQDLKAEIRLLAMHIKQLKAEIKEFQRQNAGYHGMKIVGLEKATRFFRHKHIALSLLRGTPYERIENPREGNEPNWDLIERIKSACTPHVHTDAV